MTPSFKLALAGAALLAGQTWADVGASWVPSYGDGVSKEPTTLTGCIYDARYPFFCNDTPVAAQAAAPVFAVGGTPKYQDEGLDDVAAANTAEAERCKGWALFTCPAKEVVPAAQMDEADLAYARILAEAAAERAANAAAAASAVLETAEERAARCAIYWTGCPDLPAVAVTPTAKPDPLDTAYDKILAEAAAERISAGTTSTEIETEAERGERCLPYFPFCPDKPVPSVETPAAPATAAGANDAEIAAVADQYSGSVLTGDKAAACEALMCLAAGKPPHECTPSLKKYFAISFKSAGKTKDARKDFLKLCPAASEGDMPAFVDTLASGSSSCNLEALNMVTYSEDQAPTVRSTLSSECSSYYGNAYLGGSKPMFVNAIGGGGTWVAAEDYDQALAKYNADVALLPAAPSIERGESP